MCMRMCIIMLKLAIKVNVGENVEDVLRSSENFLKGQCLVNMILSLL